MFSGEAELSEVADEDEYEAVRLAASERESAEP